MPGSVSTKVNLWRGRPRSVYEAVTPHPAGTSTVSRVAATAAEYGFDGIVVRHTEPPTEGPPITEQYGVTVVDALEIRADDPTVVAGHLGANRDDYPVIMVRGGDPDVNRYAVEDPRVDVLTAPMRAAGDINHVLATAAARNEVRLEFRLGPVLRSMGGPRVQALSRLRKLREVVADGDAPFVVSADPRSHLHLRSGRDLAAVGDVIGFDPDTVRAGLAEWQTITDQNRDRLDPTVIEPGVRITDPDDHRSTGEPDDDGGERS